MTDHLTILHLSDLQFGKNHRYPDGEGFFNSLYAKLAEDLDELAEKRSLRPTAIAVTGDVAEWSMPSEYTAAERFLNTLARKLEIGRQRVVIVPGNHDVNRDLCLGARAMAKGRGAPFEEPCFGDAGKGGRAVGPRADQRPRPQRVVRGFRRGSLRLPAFELSGIPGR